MTRSCSALPLKNRYEISQNYILMFASSAVGIGRLILTPRTCFLRSGDIHISFQNVRQREAVSLLLPNPTLVGI